MNFPYVIHKCWKISSLVHKDFLCCISMYIKDISVDLQFSELKIIEANETNFKGEIFYSKNGNATREAKTTMPKQVSVHDMCTRGDMCSQANHLRAKV